MARKLTDEERDAVEALSAILVDALPAEERSNASGIASSLVRSPEDRFSESDLAELLAKYEEGEGGLLETVEGAILVPVASEPGTYALNRAAIDDAGKAADGADETAASEEKQLAKQPRERAIARTGKSAQKAGNDKEAEQSPASGEPQEHDAAADGPDVKDEDEGKQEPEKPMRARRRSKKAAGEATAAEEKTANDTVEEAASDEAAAAEGEQKPKRRRRTRKPQAAEETAAADEAENDRPQGSGAAPAADDNGEAESAPDKDVRPGRAARARKRAEHEETLAAQKAAAAVMEAIMGKASAEEENSAGADGEKDSAAGQPAESAPKPARRPRRRTKVAAKTDATESAEADAEADAAPTENAADGPDSQEGAAEEKPARKPARRRRSRTRKAAAEDAEPAPSAAESAEADAPAAAKATEEPGTDEGSAPELPAQEPAEGDEKPAPKRRGRSHRSRRSGAKAAESAQTAAQDDANADAAPAADEAEDASDQAQAATDPGEKPVDEAGLRAVREKKEQKRDPRRIPYIRKGGEEDAEIRQKIVQLDPRFWMNGWLLSHPSAYTLYEHEITTMNDALANGTVVGDITRRQLAYQMGGDEKFFEYGNDGFRLLRALGMEDIVRRRPMPKIDLVYHAPRRRKHMRVLVTENLDPYLDVHDIMYEEGRSQILGERIHAVVLGAGSPVLEHNRMSLLLDNLGAESIEVLYWGDIDRAGLQILVRLNDILKDKYAFRTFAPAYKLMIEKAMERFPDPADNEPTGQVNIEMEDPALLCEGLTDEEAAYAREVIAECRLIPQEILTRRDL